MRVWLQLWGGHLIFVLALLALIGLGYCAWQSGASTDPSGTFWWFIVALPFGFLAVVLGILSAWKWNSKNERHYLRIGQALLEGRELSTVRGSADYHRKGVTGDPVASQGGIRDDAHGK